MRQARTSVAWSLFFIFLLYFTAPAYAAFARFTIYAKLVGTKIAELPRWVTLWQPAGLFSVVDKNGDGVVQWADFVIRSTDFVVLSMPEIAGLPFVITGLVMAGGLAAALSTADGLLLDDRQRDLPRPLLQRHQPADLADRAADDHQDPARCHGAHFGLGRDVPRGDHRGAGGLGLQPGGRLLLPGPGHGDLVEAANKTGACWGMVVGLAITAYYMIGSRFYGVSWFGTQTIASAIFGLPAGFLTIWIVSLLTAPPPKEVQDLVVSVRYPKSGQAYRGDPLGRDVVRTAP